MTKQIDKLPPHSGDSEEALLGSIILDGDVLYELPFLKEEYFFDPRCRMVFNVCLELHKNGKIDEITVAQRLNEQDKLEVIGGPAYLSHLVGILPTSLHAEYYAGVVYELWQRRRMIEISGRIAQGAYDGQPEYFNNAMSEIMSLQRERKQELISAHEAVERNIGALDRWLEGEMGLSTGLVDLDRAIMGLQAQQLYIVGGYTSMGKTELLVTITRNILKTKSSAVAFFSLEMSDTNMLKRLCLTETGLYSYSWKYTDEDKKKFMATLGGIADLPFFLDDTGGIQTSEAMARVMKLQSQQKVGLVVFDYINLAGDKGNDQKERIGNIVRGLKNLAKICDVPVVAIAQFNREITHDYIPMMRHLKDSSDIEFNADVIMLLNHWGYYLKRGELTEKQIEKYDKEGYEPNRLDIFIVKNKEGEVQKVNLFYEYRLWKIANWIKNAT